MHCDRLYQFSSNISALYFPFTIPFYKSFHFWLWKSRLATFYDLSIIHYCHNKDYVKMAPHKLNMDLLTSLYRVS